MEGLHLYIDMLRAELMATFEQLDPSVSATSILRNQDFITFARLVTSALEKSSVFATFAGITLTNTVTMGTEAQISASTIERILTSTYTPSQPFDARVLKTLNKLCIFLDYQGWDDFLARKMLATDTTKSLNQQLIEAVEMADAAEFAAYKALPTIDTSNLDKYFIIGAQAYNRIYNILVKHHFRNWIISEPLNPSDYETFSIAVKQVTANSAIVIADEWWYLRWFNFKKFKTGTVYDIRNTQTFLLQKTEEGIWKVKATEYPTKGALLIKGKRY